MVHQRFTPHRVEEMAPTPTRLTVHKGSRELEIVFDDGYTRRLPIEYLRVFSPSDEVKGSGTSEGIWAFGKEDVGIEAIEPLGNYAVRVAFTDGHAGAVFSYDKLYELATEYERNWAGYLERLAEAGVRRSE